jgi:hypothetical protein
MSSFDIDLQRARENPPDCKRCKYLNSDPLLCRIGGPLEPCDQFKDASRERTVRRGLKGVGYPR